MEAVPARGRESGTPIGCERAALGRAACTTWKVIGDTLGCWCVHDSAGSLALVYKHTCIQVTKSSVGFNNGIATSASVTSQAGKPRVELFLEIFF